MKRVFAIAALSLAVMPLGAQSPTLSLDQRVAALLPTAAENGFMQVPWRTNIMEAIAEAGRANKPVFLWVMNGNPLGCA